MAHHSKFLSVNLNKSYGKPFDSTHGYGNGRPRSAGGVGGMVVLSRPQSSSGTTAHKSASKLAVPPPVNLPSLRKEHEGFDPASSNPSSGYGGAGVGPGNGTSMGWTKPGMSSGKQQSIAGDVRPAALTEKAVILKGEDFPSLLATSASSSKQKQRQISEKYDGWEEKTDLSSVVGMRPQMRSSALIKSNVHGSDDGSNRIPYPAGQSRRADANIRAPFPPVRLRHATDWDDDERDRNHAVSASDDHDGRLLLDGEARNLISRELGGGDLHGRESMNSRKIGPDVNSRRVTFQPNRDFSMPRELHVDGEHVGHSNSSMSRRKSQENSHAGLSDGEKRDFGSVMGIGNVEVSEAFDGRAEVSKSWQRGKLFSSGKMHIGPAPSGFKSFLSKDPVLNFKKENAISNVGKSYVEGANWGGKGSFSRDAILDLNAKPFRKKKDAMNPSDFFDAVRESFEAELERVQQLQELERQQAMEEQTRAMEIARKEVEERERRVREEEERMKLLEEEARAAVWRAEKEKLEAARRTEEQRIAIKEEKKRILMEEERRKEAARQKLLELEARIAKRQTVANIANATTDWMNERYPSWNSDQTEWEKTERILKPFTSSTSSDSSFMNSFSAGVKTHNSNVGQRGSPENNCIHNRKQLQGSGAPLLLVPSVTIGMSSNQTETGQSWNRNDDFDQFNGNSNIDAAFGAWDHGHCSRDQLAPLSQKSFQNTDVENLVSVRVRQTVRQPRVPPPPSLSFSRLKNSFGAMSEGPNSSVSVNSDAKSNPTGREEESDLQIVYNRRYQQMIQEPGNTELLDGTASTLLQTEDRRSPRYDSQSSLSVSSPPTSPSQHSLEELDDCEDSPALTSFIEDENSALSDSKPMMPESDAKHMHSETTLFSLEEDYEWAVDNHEELQEGNHVVDHDIYREDNEDHEGDDENLGMENKLDDVDAVVGKPDEEMRNSSFGIIGRPQRRAPFHDLLNNDFGHAEKSINQLSPTNAKAKFEFANNSVDMLQAKDAFTDDVLNGSPEEKTAIHPPENIEASKIMGQNPVESATSLSLSSSFCSISASNPTSMDEVPVSFQFGLFSGLPLIPSPLPTIQIGSIQMPLPLPEQFDSYSQMHASHPPFFQFDQINSYAPPLSHSTLPIAAQTLSFIHPSALGHSYIGLNPGNSSSNLVSLASTPIKVLEKEQPSFPPVNQPGFGSVVANQSLENLDSEQLTELPDEQGDKALRSQSQITSAGSDEKKDVCDSFSPSANSNVASYKNCRSMVNSRRLRVWPHVDSLSSNRKSQYVMKAPGPMPEIKRNRFLHNAKITGSLPYLRTSEDLFANSYGHQRNSRRHFQGNEYRIKENGGARQMNRSENFNHSRQNEQPNHSNIDVGVSSRNMGEEDSAIPNSEKITDEEAAPAAQDAGASSMSRANKKETVQKMDLTTFNFRGGERIFKKNGLLEDDIDAHLLSGVVRIFNQPGIEASTDGDGFVEVRSKRKVSNERRGQKERETNPSYKALKVPRKPRTIVSNNTVASRSDMVPTLACGAALKGLHSDSGNPIIRPQAALEAPFLPTTGLEGQTTPPIGTPAMNSTNFKANLKTLNSPQVGSAAENTSDVTKLMPSLSFGNNIFAHDKGSVPLGAWGTVHLNHQAITSTISQLDEASNPIESNPPSADEDSLDDSDRKTSTMTNEKPYFPSADAINFPFARDKIQFGAVELPPTLTSPSQSVSSGSWPPSYIVLNPSIIHNVNVNENSQRSFIEKEKCAGVSCTHLDENEAQAEAEAVAVAAFSNDEISVRTLGKVSTSDIVSEGLNNPDLTRFADVVGQSASDELLVATLPADLSVETQHSFWPPLPGIHSSRPVLSHIAVPQPSSFPFFDPKPIMGGPIFPFRPQNESAGSHEQPQQNAPFGSLPTGTWSQCHSGVDTIYSSPAGFPAFMSPTGGLSGVHPQMVFYNHFAPVGQFGQVGLSYMGTTYIPTGKQPDWKHNSESFSMNMNKADPSNQNFIYGQQKVAHVPTLEQHLPSGSAVNPVNLHFPMINFRPFQSPTETSAPLLWSPIPHPSPHSILFSNLPEQLQSLPVDVSVTYVNSNVPHSAAADLPDELGLLESTASNSADANPIQPSRKPGMPSSANSFVSHGEDGKIVGIQSLMAQKTISPVPQNLGPIGKADQQKVTVQKTSFGSSEWRQRNAFPGKNRNVGSDKIIGSIKMKQIYVAKSLSS